MTDAPNPLTLWDDYEPPATSRRRMSQQMGTMVSQLTDECYTPPWFMDRVHTFLGGVELDPASCEVANRTVRAERYYTQRDGGLSLPWACRTLYCNPPYTNNQVRRWTRKIAAAWRDGHIREGAVMLTNSAPGYDWWHELINGAPVVLCERRMTFIQEDGTPYGDHHKKGQTVSYYGRDVRGFIRTFGDLGRVLLPGPFLSELIGRLEALQDALAGAKRARPSLWGEASHLSGLASLATLSAIKLDGRMEVWEGEHDAAA